jgi:hypothetical protein
MDRRVKPGDDDKQVPQRLGLEEAHRFRAVAHQHVLGLLCYVGFRVSTRQLDSDQQFSVL